MESYSNHWKDIIYNLPAQIHATDIYQGPVPERKNKSIPGINVPYSRDNFIPGLTSVPERRNSAMQGINLG